MQIDLSVQNVTKKFKDFVAVDGVSFDVADGQFFSILGPSGCGKTTLLRMIAGLTEPSAGKYRDSRPKHAGHSPESAAREFDISAFGSVSHDECGGKYCLWFKAAPRE
jgi:ABC-type multidrug transport system ATPase subunit